MKIHDHIKKVASRALFCPRCNSSRIHPASNSIAGGYACPDCGYYGSLIIEKTFAKR